MSKPQDLDLSDERLGGLIRELHVYGDGKIVAINGHGAENYWSGAQIAELLTALAEQRKALLAWADECEVNDDEHYPIISPASIRAILGVKP